MGSTWGPSGASAAVRGVRQGTRSRDAHFVFFSFVRNSVFYFCDTVVLARGFYQIQWRVGRTFHAREEEEREGSTKCKTRHPGELLASAPLHTSAGHWRIPDTEQKAGGTGEVGEEKRQGKKATWTHVLWVFAMPACRSWQADSVDSGCSSCAQTSPPHPEPCCVGVDPLHGHAFAGQADPYSPEKLQPPPLKVSGNGQGASGAP